MQSMQSPSSDDRRSQEVRDFASAVADFLRQHSAELRLYDWEIEPEVLEEARDRWQVEIQPGTSVFEATNLLRMGISDRARRHWESPADLLQLAEFVIKRWGALRGNASTTVSKYVERFRIDGLAPPLILQYTQFSAGNGKGRRGSAWEFKGIASWSKWLNFVWPDWALIYDARIAFALNAIHFISGLDTRVFPSPPGRNPFLKNFDSESIAALRLLAKSNSEPGDAEELARCSGSLRFAKDEAYPIYLDMMNVAHAQVWGASAGATPLVHTEMLLFRLSVSHIPLHFVRAGVRAFRKQEDPEPSTAT